MVKKLIVAVCLGVGLAGNAVGQFFNTGQESSSLKWMQLSTDRFIVIYPSVYRSEALRLSRFLNAAADSNGQHVRQPIKVVLHTWNPRSNGFVAVAPRRMELYTISPQDQYPQEWLNQLALHEYRHVIQMDRLNHGLVRAGSFLLGEQGWGLAAALVPPWFLEGDAVLAETQFSETGRGRLPSFDQGHRTAILSGKKYSYDKWLMGSYKDYIPNHYELGYKLVTYGEMKYGVNIWNSIMDYTARRPYTLAPFFFGLKKYAGVSRSQLFSDTFNYCDSVWQQQPDTLVCEGKVLSADKDNCYVDEKYPVFINDSTLLVYRTSLKQGPRLMAINMNGVQNIVFKPNYIADAIGGSGQLVVWNEYLPSYRWGQQGISTVKILDLKNRHERLLKSNLQLFSPAVNASGTLLVAVGVANDGQNTITCFDIDQGNEVFSKAFPVGVSVQNPKWVAGDTSITYTKVDSLGKSLCLFNRDYNTETLLIAHSKTDLANPVSYNKYIIFSSYNSLVNNLFAIDTSSKALYQITHSRFGCAAPTISPNGKHVAFERYTPSGNRISVAMLDTCLLNAVHGGLGYSHPFEKYLASKSNSVRLDTVNVNTSSITRYRKGLHLFRIHSWAPFFYDPFQVSVTSAEFKPGLSLISQNALSTTTAVLGVSMNDGNPNYHARIIYQEWFPVLNLSADYGAQTLVYRDGAAKYIQIAQKDRLEVIASVLFPYNLTYNSLLQSIVPSVSLGYTNDYLYFRNDSSYARGYKMVNYRIVYYAHRPSAPRDLRPPWATLVDLRYRNTPFEDENTGSVYSAQVKQTTPGLFANHSFMATFSYQKQQVQKYYLSSFIPFPRGYLAFSNSELIAVSADYAFPLIYPDLAIPSVLYLKRIRANAFYDFAKDSWLVYNKTTKQRDTQWEYIYSYGIDVGFDYHLFRNAFPISTTLRFGNTRSNQLFFNIFFGITFNN